MKVYIHECATCGKVRSQLARLRAKGRVEVVDTRLSKDLEAEHLQILVNAGMRTDRYHAVVVDDDVVRLLEVV